MTKRTNYKIIASISLLVGLFSYFYFFTGVFGDTRINLTIRTNPDLEDGLIAHWTFDGDIDLIEDYGSGGSVDDELLLGIAYSPPATSTFVLPGPIGQALTAGTEIVTLGAYDSADFDLYETSDNVTFAGWFNHTGQIGTITPFLDHGGSGNTRIYIDDASVNGIDICFEVAGTNSCPSSLEQVMQYDEWHHLAMTYDQQFVRIYQNGEEVYSVAETGAIPATTDNFCIGSTDAGGPGCEDQIDTIAVDDVRVYDRALSASEILRLYQLGATTKVNKTITTNPELNDDLVAHFTFDGPTVDISSTTAEFAEVSPNGFYGDWINENQLVRGKIGQAIDFSASFSDNDRVQIDDDEYDLSLAGEGNVTFAAWIYPRSLGQGNDGRVVDHGGSSGNGDGYTFGLISNNGMFLAINGTSGNFEAVTFNDSVTLNEWQHVVGVYDDAADTGTIYINGVDVTDDNSIVKGAILNTNADNLRIGLRATDNARDFDGYIDDVRIYTRSFTQEEVTRLYQLGATTEVNKTIRTNPDLNEDLFAHVTFDGSDMDLSNAAGEFSVRGTAATVADWREHATNTTFGVIGQAIELDGDNDYVYVAGPTSNLSQSSVLAWMKPDNVSDGVTDIVSPEAALAVALNNDELRSSHGAGCCFHDTVGVDIEVDRWYHVAATFNEDTNTVRIYVNGEEVYLSTSETGNIPNDDNHVHIGRWGGGGGNFDGTIDDVRVYHDRELTAEEIQRIYQLGR